MNTSASRLLPTFQMLLLCAECGRGIEVPLPTDRSLLAIFLARQGWFMSVLKDPSRNTRIVMPRMTSGVPTSLGTTPPDQSHEIPIVLGALCFSCAPSVWPPEALKAAEEWRQKVLTDKPCPSIASK